MLTVKKGDMVRLLYTTQFPLDVISFGKLVRKGIFTVKAGAIGRVTQVWNTTPQKSFIVKFAGVGEPHNIGEIELEPATALDLINYEVNGGEKVQYRRSSGDQN